MMCVVWMMSVTAMFDIPKIDFKLFTIWILQQDNNKSLKYEKY